MKSSQLFFSLFKIQQEQNKTKSTIWSLHIEFSGSLCSLLSLSFVLVHNLVSLLENDIRIRYSHLSTTDTKGDFRAQSKCILAAKLSMRMCAVCQKVSNVA